MSESWCPGPRTAGASAVIYGIRHQEFQKGVSEESTKFDAMGIHDLIEIGFQPAAAEKFFKHYIGHGGRDSAHSYFFSK